MCLILGFKNINRTLLEQAKKAYKCSLKSLEYLPDYVSSVSYHEGKAVYICSAEPPGDLSLACWNFVPLSSRLETAKEFCLWVFEEVLPAICGAGKLEASLRQELVLKDRAVGEQNKWTTLHMLTM